MKLLIPATLIALIILSPIAAGQVMTARTTYSCADGILEVNKSSVLGGTYVEQFKNESCPGGCATNGEECNSPLNVDKFGIAIAAAIFLAAAGFFFVLSNSVKTSQDSTLRVIKAFHTLKYLHLILSFMCVSFSLLLLAGMYTAGQNEISTFIMVGWLSVVAGAILTFSLLFFSEVDTWVKKLQDIGKRPI